MEDEALPLEGLYLHLVRSGFPISVRDFEDALAALRLGHGTASRDRLHWLCRTLWARGDEEVARFETLFRRFPRPPAAQVLRWTGAAEPAPADPSHGPAARADREGAAAEPAGEGRTVPLVEFAAAAHGEGGLPAVRVGPAPLRRYVFEPRPPIPLRALIVAWRRFRRAQRCGAKTELDIDATVAEQCRTGAMLAPVFVAPRRNRARLLVLVDASTSMVAWHGMNRLFAQSLAQGQLGHVRLLYFDNDPIDTLYETDAPSGALARSDALDANPECALLVVSDAGAARGRVDRARIAGTRAFIEQVRAHWHPIAWLNPMPRARWMHTSAQHIAALPGVAMGELSADGLIRAVDILRGLRA